MLPGSLLHTLAHSCTSPAAPGLLAGTPHGRWDGHGPADARVPEDTGTVAALWRSSYRASQHLNIVPLVSVPMFPMFPRLFFPSAYRHIDLMADRATDGFGTSPAV